MRILLIPLLALFITGNLIARENPVQPGSDKVTGIVTSASTGLPLEGVEISVGGMESNFYTDSTGKYTIPFNGEDFWAVYNYPGYSAKELLVSGSGEYSLVMYPVHFKSNDSEASGFFGDIQKYNNASSDYFESVNISAGPVLSMDDMIQGRLAGLNAINMSGIPGEGSILNLRGVSSLFGGQEPLVVLDGMPVNSDILENRVTPGNYYNPLRTIDANDVKRIEVIRDGGSLYGIRGGNGVVLITTRQPESVTTSVNFSAMTGVTMEPERIELLDAAGYKTYLVNQLRNTGLSFTEVLQQNQWISGNPSYVNYYNYDNNTDWQEEIYHPAYTAKFNVDLEGGDEIARFAVLLGYLNQQGVVENTRYQRYNFRLNSDIRVLQKLSMVSNVGFSYHVSDLNNFGMDPRFNPVLSALTKGPMFNPYLRDSDGNRIAIYSNSDEYGFSNPSVIVNRSVSNSYESNFFTNLKLVYDPLLKLNLVNIINVSFDNIREDAFIPDYGIVDFNYGELRNAAAEGNYKNYNIANEAAARFSDVIGQDHFINAKAGLRVTSLREEYNKGQVYNTPTDEFRSLSSVSTVENTYIEGDTKRVNYSDIFLNGNYRYKNRYLLDVILSFSASSNTGEQADALDLFGGKWGFYPSVHAGWILSSESFLQPASRLDLLKLRLSYSVSGNDFFTKQSGYYYNARSYGVNSGIIRDYLPDRNLKWENIGQLNAGLDISMFHERIKFNLDVFSRTTNDLLTYRQLPLISGFSFYWENNGSLNTKGIELTAEITPTTGRFRLSLGANLSLSKNTLDLDHDIVIEIPGGYVVMQDEVSAFSYYGWENKGLFESDNAAENSGLLTSSGNNFQGGDLIFNDKLSDGVIDENDRVNLGNLFPTTQAGMYISLKYSKLGLYVLADYRGGNKIFNFTRMKIESFSGFENQSVAAYYAWKNENDETNIPRIAYGDPSGNARFSDRWIEDGSFFRLREVTLSYDLGKTSLYDNMRLYITAQNLITYSKYLGYYPEFSWSSNPLYFGSDYGQMPITPRIMLGINVGF